MDAERLYSHPGKKTKSLAWVHFKFKKDPCNGELDLETAVCSICRKTYSNKGNTTNLLHHLKQDHPEVGNVPSSSLASAEIVQPRIDVSLMSSSEGRTMKLTTTRRSEVDNTLQQLMVEKALPLSLLDNALFKEFVKKLEPRYDVPSSSSTLKKLQVRMASMTDKIKCDLAGQTVSLTHDGWTSLSTQSYDTVTCHMINDNWELKSAVLQTKKIEGQHTGENIAKNLNDTISAWGLQTAYITTDNAANEVKAVSLAGLNRFGCFGHRINLIVKKSLQSPVVSALLKKGRSLVSFFHKSSSATDVLLQKQKMVFAPTSGAINHRLVMDCVTRWNSTLQMLAGLLEQMPAIVTVASDGENLSKSATNTIKSNVYSFEEQRILQEVVQLLDIFEKATKILCKENSPSIQNVCAVTNKLRKSVQQRGGDCVVVQYMKEIMLIELEKRTTNEDISLLAALLNPDTKHLPFLEEDEREKAISLLTEKAYELSVTVKKETKKPAAQIEAETLPALPNLPSVPEENNQDTGDQGEPLAKKPRIVCSDSIDWLSDVCITGESSVPVEDLVKEELNRYIRSERKESDSSLTLLEWWRENAIQYPRISKIAKTVLAVPASSVPSERVFSLAGNIVNKKRARLRPEHVNMLIFLKMNRKLYW